MKYSARIKPISYVKANAAELIKELAEKREPLVITQNGEATAVMQDVASYEATQETLALGIREYGETFFKPYRIIYRIQRRQVHVYLIADGRRDMQTLLARRLLGG